MYVRDILATKGHAVVTSQAGDAISDFAQRLVDHGIGATVVVDANNDVIGVISERDVVEAIAVHGPQCLEMTVGDLMTGEVITCSPNASIDEVMGMMTESRIRHLPILENGRLMGIVSIGDAVKNRIAEVEREADQLREYITA